MILFSFMLVTDSILCLGASSPTPKYVVMKTLFQYSGLQGCRQAFMQGKLSCRPELALCRAVLLIQCCLRNYSSFLSSSLNLQVCLIKTTHIIFYLCNGLFISVRWEFDLIIQTSVFPRCVKVQFPLAAQPFLTLLHFHCSFHCTAN